MAKKKEETKIVLERTYNIPLRRQFLKVPRHKRAKKAAKAVREFLIKHMKSDKVKLGKFLNEELWKHGIKNPPHHIKVDAKKDSEGLVKAELFGAPVEEKKEGKKEVKKEDKPKEEPKVEEKKEDKPVEAKKEEKVKEEKAKRRS